MKALCGCLVVVWLCAFAPVVRGQQVVPDLDAAPELPPTETIVEKMVMQGRWNDQAIHAFEELRLFQASNPRFKQDATREVRTTFRAPDFYESVIVKEEGSRMIRQRVFDPILDAEKEAQPKKEKNSYDILPQNYVFRAVGLDSCGDRRCYRLAISPKRKNKFLLDGFIWVDAEDYGIAKVQGSPSKRLSFWVLKTRVTRTYVRMGNVWLTDRIESDSDLFIAGRSSLSIDYTYPTIETDDPCPTESCLRGVN
jgi:hypothetical protein